MSSRTNFPSNEEIIIIMTVRKNRNVNSQSELEINRT